MKQVTCPYTKISETDAMKNLANFSFVTKAEATPADLSNISLSTNQNTLSSQLSIPFYLLIFSFFLFVLLMTGVYIYHWVKFSLNDPFIKNFIPIFFFGLVLLTIPLVFNLFI